jgi:hypothetical protein
MVEKMRGFSTMNKIRKMILKNTIRRYRYRRLVEDLAVLAVGLGVGSGLMYLCDPDRGLKRRKRLSGEASRMLQRSETTIAKHGKEVASRVRDMVAKAAA